jgi:hypothetical protein
MPGFWGATNPSCLSVVVSGNIGFFSDFKSAHFQKFDTQVIQAVVALATMGPCQKDPFFCNGPDPTLNITRCDPTNHYRRKYLSIGMLSI